jgi:DNA-binding CsgD family transcriptional regulator
VIREIQVGPLVGREGELQAIAGLLDGVRERGAALIVRGDAGIGKSALLAAARSTATNNGMLVLSTVGVQSETDLPFAGLHQLLRPILDRLGGLPPVQRDAVRAAFGMAPVAGAEPFLIGLAALGLLSDAAGGRPLALLLEDAHWLDRPTADALAFVGRRVDSDPIVLLAATREGYESPLLEAGLPELHVDGLAEEPARQLLDAHFPTLAPTLRERLLGDAEGNPLALLELPAAYGLGIREHVELPSYSLPLTERLEQAFASRATDLPAATQALLLAAAVSETSGLEELLSVAEAIEGRRPTVDDLVAATSARLIEVDRLRVRFSHPLVRSAIYQAATVGQRYAAHGALAEMLADDPERRVWHRAAAAVGTDREVAVELEEAGGRALARGGIPTAAAAFERAAALTPDPAHRGRLLQRAADAACDLGRSDIVMRLLHEADSLDLDPHERARWIWLEDAFHEGPVGDPAHVQSLVETATRVAAAGDRDLALALLTAAAARCYWGNLREQGRDLIAVADGLGVAVDDQRLLYVQVLAAPIERGGSVLHELERTVPPEDPAALYLRGMAVCLAGAFDEAGPLLAASARRLREQGRLRMLAQVLAYRGWAAVMTADFAVAMPATEEAIRLLSETAQPTWEAGSRAAAATLAGLRGERATVETLVAEVERVALPAGAASMLSLVQYARGLLELGQGRHAQAYEELRRIAEPGDAAHHDLTRLTTFGDLAEAAAHSGHRDAASELMRELEPRARATSASWVQVTMLYAQAQLAADDEAQDVFEEALSQDLAAWPLVRARLSLAYGEWLRRQRRVVESRASLRAARDAFDALSVAPWAERARRELRASGESSRRRTSDSLDELTPQQLQIVQMAAQGLSNREIGEQLYLSHRTVESHLYRVFPKLGVTSRAQLAGALGTRLGAPA